MNRIIISLIFFLNVFVLTNAQKDCKFYIEYHYMIPDCYIDTCLGGWFINSKETNCEIVSIHSTIYDTTGKKIIFDKDEYWYGRVEGKKCYHHPGKYPYRLKIKTKNGKKQVLTGKMELILMQPGSICDTVFCPSNLREIKKTLLDKDSSYALQLLDNYINRCIYQNKNDIDSLQLFNFGVDFFNMLPTDLLLSIFWYNNYDLTDNGRKYKGIIIRKIMKEDLCYAAHLMELYYGECNMDDSMLNAMEEYLKTHGY